MTDKPGDLAQGTLDMLVLKTVALEPIHGYGIAVRIQQMSKGESRLNAGSLFVAIQRLERDGLIRSEWNPKIRSVQSTRTLPTWTAPMLSFYTARVTLQGGHIRF
jgi:hypothetical protein